MPIMPGMGATATNAAVTGAASANGLNGNTGGLGTWQSTNTGQIFNTQTGQMQDLQPPGFFGQGGMAQVGLGAISSLGSLWNSFQQSKIAKKALAFQERTFETNLANQTQSYNTELEDRIRNRYAGSGVTGDELENRTQSYVDKNKL